MTTFRSNPKPWVCDQGTPEWWEARRGRPTASQFHRVFTEGGQKSMNRAKTDWSEQAKAYMAKLVAERILEIVIEEKIVSTYWVEWGKLQEPSAIKAFAKSHKLISKEINFFTNFDDKIGCSPDAVVEGSYIPVEIKCPAPNTLMGYHLFGLETTYKPQVQGQMLVTGAREAHLYVYHPRMPPYYVHTVRDDAYVRGMATVLKDFCDTLDEKEAEARRLGTYMSNEEFNNMVDDGVIVFPGAFPWRERS